MRSSRTVTRPVCGEDTVVIARHTLENTLMRYDLQQNAVVIARCMLGNTNRFRITQEYGLTRLRPEPGSQFSRLFVEYIVRLVSLMKLIRNGRKPDTFYFRLHRT